MRMLLRGVIEEREILVTRRYNIRGGQDEYDPISVRAEDSPVSRLHLIKTVSSNKELTESLALQFPNLYEGRKYYKSHHKMESKRTSPLPLVKKKTPSPKKPSPKKPSPKRRTTQEKKKKNGHRRTSSPKQKNSRKKSLKINGERKDKKRRVEMKPLGNQVPSSVITVTHFNAHSYRKYRTRFLANYRNTIRIRDKPNVNSLNKGTKIRPNFRRREKDTNDDASRFGITDGGFSVVSRYLWDEDLGESTTTTTTSTRLHHPIFSLQMPTSEFTSVGCQLRNYDSK